MTLQEISWSVSKMSFFFQTTAIICFISLHSDLNQGHQEQGCVNAYFINT